MKSTKRARHAAWLAARAVAVGVVMLSVATPVRAQDVTPQSASGDAKKAKSAKPEETAKGFKAAIEVVAPPVVAGEHVTRFASVVSTVSANQIEDLGAGDLASALRFVPGVTISRYDLVGSYGGGDGGAIYVRGQGSGRPGAEIVTMVDGIPSFAAVWTHPLLDLLATDMAGRVDVYKSPQPVLFGNMAFAGVNLVPKSITEEGEFTRVMGSWGESRTGAGVVEHGAKLGALDYYVLGSERASDGNRPDAGGRVRTLYGRVGYEVADGWNMSVQVHADDSWADDPGRVGVPKPPVVPRFAVQDTLSIATLSEEHGNHSGTVKLFYDDGTITWRQWDGTNAEAVTEVGKYENFGVHAQERLHLAGRTELVVGFDHDRYGGSDRNSYPEGSPLSLFFPELLLSNDALYAMVARTFGTGIEVTPSLGVRYTDSSEFGGHASGQAGVVVRSGSTELHANVAHAFNLPGVWTAVMYAGWGGGGSWKDLKPEQLDHAEIGISQGLGSDVHVGLTVFDDHASDALVFVAPPPPPPMFANVGSSTIVGAEATASVTPNGTAAFFLGVTYLDSRPSTVSNAPRWSLEAGASWLPVERLRVNVDAEWVDAQTVLNPRFATGQAWIASYVLINGKLAYRVATGPSLVAELFVTWENLAGRSYQYRPGYPAPGRVLSAGVDVRL
jgi:outer membrane cobalamin receptor